MRNQSVLKLTVSGLLIAIGIVIPLISPVKIILEPASFTLASHVAIFIAMFISPGVAAAVSLGTTAGFLLSGFPLVVVLRALSQVVFAVGGSVYLKRISGAGLSALRLRMFSLAVALVHAAGEAVVAGAFYFGGAMGSGYYEKGFAVSVLLLVGLGTVVHSMVDFEIANVILIALRHHKGFRGLFHGE